MSPGWPWWSVNTSQELWNSTRTDKRMLCDVKAWTMNCLSEVGLVYTQ